jgi:energy-coupling factor transporter transmembrane protein EcfT
MEGLLTGLITLLVIAIVIAIICYIVARLVAQFMPGAAPYVWLVWAIGGLIPLTAANSGPACYWCGYATGAGHGKRRG